MKFAHIADCHIGGWREPKLRQLNLEAFKQAAEICIARHVAFILIAGDLFNTALPTIDILKNVAEILQEIHEHNISVYIIPGSHDFSSSGKTMLDVLEKAGLCENVVKFKEENNKIKLEFTTDKTGVKITGLFGKKGGLEKNYFDLLDKQSLEKEPGFKIFMLHSALTEYKPKNLTEMDSICLNSLPKGFNYYANGHVHYVFNKKEPGYGQIVFPGPLFPNNFKEIEDLKHGGFYIIDDKLNLEYISIKLKEVVSVEINADDKKPNEIEQEILGKVKDYKDKIVTIRIQGTLASGKPSDIDFKEVFSKLNNAYFVMKNTNKLSSKEFEELRIKASNVEEIEQEIIKEHKNQEEFKDEKLIINLMHALNKEKVEGERNIDFENRIIKEVIEVLNLREKWRI